MSFDGAERAHVGLLPYPFSHKTKCNSAMFLVATLCGSLVRGCSIFSLGDPTLMDVHPVPGIRAAVLSC